MASNSVERSDSLTGSILKGTLKAVGGTLLGIIMIGGAAMAGGTFAGYSRANTVRARGVLL